ncbi:MAG: aldehyde dehydrogenase [Bacteroidota bacterium]
MAAYSEQLDQQRRYFSSGATRPVSFRKTQLKTLRQLLIDHEKQLIEAVHADFKKPPFETYGTEIGIVRTELGYALKHLEEWVKPQTVSSTLVNFPSKNYIITEPYGNALIIAPWNYPVQLALLPLVGAISAGNTALVKPSELTPATSEVLKQLIGHYFDPSYIHVELGGVETSQALLNLPFNYIFFTGSTRVGKLVMKAAAEHLTPLTLELGGKSPCIIDETANLEITAKRIVWGKFVNAGQTCVAPDYLLVHRSVKDRLVQQLILAIEALYGTDPSLSPDYPRIVNQGHFDRLAALIDPEKVVIGGHTKADECYIAPTVLDHVTWDDRVMEDEIFGPILPVMSYEQLDECIQMVNAQPRPLALYVFSNDSRTQDRLTEEISFGGGAINDTIAQLGNHHLGFGGVGASGFGSYHGKASFDSFSHRKSVMKKPFWPDVPVRYAPYEGKMGIIKSIMK